jgi:hypothetical protein
MVLLCAGQVAGQGVIRIRVTEGDGAINSIRLKRAHDPAVQVTDAVGEPVAGASVSFLLPASGPGGMFGESALSVTVQTDARGMAQARGLRPNGVEGQFPIRVTASWHSQTASATITQTNAEPVVNSGRTKKIVILALIGGAAAAGVAIAAGGKSSSAAQVSAGTTPATASIAAGTPSIGPPR